MSPVECGYQGPGECPSCRVIHPASPPATGKAYPVESVEWAHPSNEMEPDTTRITVRGTIQPVGAGDTIAYVPASPRDNGVWKPDYHPKTTDGDSGKSAPVASGTPEVLGETCIDGGKCHHECKEKCFRRESCGPLSGYVGPWSYKSPAPAEQLTNPSTLAGNVNNPGVDQDALNHILEYIAVDYCGLCASEGDADAAEEATNVLRSKADVEVRALIDAARQEERERCATVARLWAERASTPQGRITLNAFADIIAVSSEAP